MLVITRKQNESLVIGDNITITVLGVIGGKVRLGVEAPKEIPIRREENLTEEQLRRSIDAQP